MAKYAVIENNVVVNVALADEAFAQKNRTLIRYNQGRLKASPPCSQAFRRHVFQ